MLNIYRYFRFLCHQCPYKVLSVGITNDPRWSQSDVRKVTNIVTLYIYSTNGELDDLPVFNYHLLYRLGQSWRS